MIERVLPARSLRPSWSSATALVYVGAFVVLFATAALLGILNDLHGEAALVGYAALVTGLAAGLALVLEAGGRPVAAGVAATVAVVLFAVLVGSILSLVGVLDTDSDYQPATHVLELAVAVAALLALHRFRAPLLVLVLALTFWITLVDIASAVFSWDDAEEAVSLAAGVLLAAAGLVVDRSAPREYGFWLHTTGGVAFGGAVLALVWGDAGWALVGALSLAYVAAAYRLERSSYAVLGAIGILATTMYFAVDASTVVGSFFTFGEPRDEGSDAWQVALWFVGAGLLIGLLGLVGERVTAALRRR